MYHKKIPSERTLCHHDLGDASECFGMMFREIRKDLSVKRDLLFTCRTEELRI